MPFDGRSNSSSRSQFSHPSSSPQLPVETGAVCTGADGERPTIRLRTMEEPVRSNGKWARLPTSDGTAYDPGGVRKEPQASRMSLLLMALLTVVIFAVVYFVLTQTAVFGG